MQRCRGVITAIELGHAEWNYRRAKECVAAHWLSRRVILSTDIFLVVHATIASTVAPANTPLEGALPESELPSLGRIEGLWRVCADRSKARTLLLRLAGVASGKSRFSAPVSTLPKYAKSDEPKGLRWLAEYLQAALCEQGWPAPGARELTKGLATVHFRLWQDRPCTDCSVLVGVMCACHTAAIPAQKYADFGQRHCRYAIVNFDVECALLCLSSIELTSLWVLLDGGDPFSQLVKSRAHQDAAHQLVSVGSPQYFPGYCLIRDLG